MSDPVGYPWFFLVSALGLFPAAVVLMSVDWMDARQEMTALSRARDMAEAGMAMNNLRRIQLVRLLGSHPWG